MRKILIPILFLLVISSFSYAEPIRKDHLSVDLISEVTFIRPGQPFWVAVKFDLDKHWHIYWKNPGDAGTIPEIQWQLPAGFTYGEIQWPYPEFIKIAHLANYAYKDEVLLLTEITPPADLVFGDSITFQAQVSWLVCKEDCTPGRAILNLQLPVIDGAPPIDGRWQELFYSTRAKLPLLETDWSFKSELVYSFLIISGKTPTEYYNDLVDLRFFPFEYGVIQNVAPQIFELKESGFKLSIPLDPTALSKPDEIGGVIVAKGGWRGPGSEQAHEVRFSYKIDVSDKADDLDPGNFFIAIIFAFLGGLILNLMPCVLPVLSIKILGFVQMSKGGKKDIFKHGLFFALGVLASFWFLVFLLLVLQAAGQQIGWGFQLQEPIFLFILVAFFFLFGLSLFGIFEIGLGLATFGSKVKTNNNHHISSFFNGVIATLVATPCTAPFMGSALGFAMTQPAWVSFTVFTSLALGMSSPYIILSAKPEWLSFVPKPGRWMESLRQFFGFLLLATALWLLWVFGLQKGPDSIIEMLIALLFIGIAAWIYGRWGNIAQDKRIRIIARFFSFSLLFITLFISIERIGAIAETGSDIVAEEESENIQWQKYSSVTFEKAMNSGKPVFIDFTAAWCLSCQVNEKVALDVSKVERRFKELGVIALKADWTNRDAEVTAALAEYGRNSVPLYVLYGKDRGNPVFLPSILTPGMVLTALENFNNN